MARGAPNEHHVIYKAIADFSQLYKEAAAAKATLAALKADADRLGVQTRDLGGRGAGGRLSAAEERRRAAEHVALLNRLAADERRAEEAHVAKIARMRTETRSANRRANKAERDENERDLQKLVYEAERQLTKLRSQLRRVNRESRAQGVRLDNESDARIGFAAAKTVNAVDNATKVAKAKMKAARDESQARIGFAAAKSVSDMNNAANVSANKVANQSAESANRINNATTAANGRLTNNANESVARIRDRSAESANRIDNATTIAAGKLENNTNESIARVHDRSAIAARKIVNDANESHAKVQHTQARTTQINAQTSTQLARTQGQNIANNTAIARGQQTVNNLQAQGASIAQRTAAAQASSTQTIQNRQTAFLRQHNHALTTNANQVAAQTARVTAAQTRAAGAQAAFNAQQIRLQEAHLRRVTRHYRQQGVIANVGTGLLRLGTMGARRLSGLPSGGPGPGGMGTGPPPDWFGPLEAASERFERRLKSTGRWLISFRGLILALILVIGPLVSVLGAAGAALIAVGNVIGSVAGVLVAVPGLFAAVGVAVTALIVSLQPLAKVFQAYTAAQKAATAGSREMGEIQQQSADRVRNATRTYVTAANSMRSVQDEERRSQERLNTARRDATRGLEDLRLQLERAALDETGAVLALQEAQLEYQRLLNAPGTTNVEKAQGALRVRDAELALREIRVKNVRLAEDAAEAEKKGVEGSDQVRDARKAAADATDNATEANLRLVDAEKDLKKAREEQAAGGAAALKAQQAYLDELDKLGPKTRAVAEAFFNPGGILDALKALQRATSENLFGPLVARVGLLRLLLPYAANLLTGAAKALGQVAARAIDMVAAWPAEDWSRMVQTNGRVITALGDAAIYLTKGLKDVALAAAPFTEWISEALAGVAEDFADWGAKARGNGELAAYLNDTKSRLQDLGVIVRNIGSWFSSLYTSSKEFTTWFLERTKAMTLGWKEWGEQAEQSGSGMRRGLESMKPLLGSMREALSGIADAFLDIASDPANIKEAQNILRVLVRELLPQVVRFFTELSGTEVVSTILSAVATAMNAVNDVLARTGALPLKIIIGGLEAVAWFFGQIASMPGVGLAFGGLLSFFAALAAATTIARFTGLFAVIRGLRFLLQNAGNLRSAFTRLGANIVYGNSPAQQIAQSTNAAANTAAGALGTAATGLNTAAAALNRAAAALLNAALAFGGGRGAAGSTPVSLIHPGRTTTTAPVSLIHPGRTTTVAPTTPVSLIHPGRSASAPAFGGFVPPASSGYTRGATAGFPIQTPSGLYVPGGGLTTQSGLIIPGGRIAPSRTAGGVYVPGGGLWTPPTSTAGGLIVPPSAGPAGAVGAGARNAAGQFVPVTSGAQPGFNRTASGMLVPPSVAPSAFASSPYLLNTGNTTPVPTSSTVVPPVVAPLPPRGGLHPLARPPAGVRTLPIVSSSPSNMSRLVTGAGAAAGTIGRGAAAAGGVLGRFGAGAARFLWPLALTGGIMYGINAWSNRGQGEQKRRAEEQAQREWAEQLTQTASTPGEESRDEITRQLDLHGTLDRARAFGIGGTRASRAFAGGGGALTNLYGEIASSQLRDQAFLAARPQIGKQAMNADQIREQAKDTADTGVASGAGFGAGIDVAAALDDDKGAERQYSQAEIDEYKAIGDRAEKYKLLQDDIKKAMEAEQKYYLQKELALTNVWGPEIAAAEIHAEKVRKATYASEGFTDQQIALTEALATFGSQAATAADKAAALGAAYDLVYGAQSRAYDAGLDYQEGLDNLKISTEGWSKAQVGARRNLDLNEREGRDAARAIKTQIDLAREQLQTEIEAGDGTKESVDKATAAYRARLEEIKKTGGESGIAEGATQKLIERFGQLPTDVTTKFSQDGVEGVDQQFTIILNKAEHLIKYGFLPVGDSYTTNAKNPLLAAPTTGGGGGGGGGKIVARAFGGPVVGPGTGTSDDVLLWGSNGEFMQPTASVRYYGTDLMEALRHRKIPRDLIAGMLATAEAYANGGTVRPGRQFPGALPEDIAGRRPGSQPPSVARTSIDAVIGQVAGKVIGKRLFDVVRRKATAAHPEMAGSLAALTGFSGGGLVGSARMDPSMFYAGLSSATRGASVPSMGAVPAGSSGSVSSVTNAGLSVGAIVINNPVPEPAGESMYRAVRKLAFEYDR